MREQPRTPSARGGSLPEERIGDASAVSERAATHKSLRDEVARGRFRQDLYFRLNGITLVVVPLRERKDAIPALAQEFLADAAARNARVPAPRLSAACLASLANHDWPGNVRELKTMIERAVPLAPHGDIQPRHIILDPPAVVPQPPAALPHRDGADEADERQRIIAALDSCAGNQTKAARMLGVSRATLVKKLALLRIPRRAVPRHLPRLVQECQVEEKYYFGSDARNRTKRHVALPSPP